MLSAIPMSMRWGRGRVKDGKLTMEVHVITLVAMAMLSITPISHHDGSVRLATLICALRGGGFGCLFYPCKLTWGQTRLLH